jgi:nicotinamidase-related amidase
MKKFVIVTGMGFMITAAAVFAQSSTVIEQWGQVKPPAAPELKAVKIDPAVTALLILDIEDRTVTPRPRAVAAVPTIKKLMDWARSNKVIVAYSNTGAGSPETILPQVKPQAGEHVVKASVDKFYNTDLEKFLKDKNITTVIITGTAAEGAVLGTSIGASLRGFKVIVPVDGMPSSEIYAEQYVVWHLLNAPGTKGNVTVTRSDMISK